MLYLIDVPGRRPRFNPWVRNINNLRYADDTTFMAESEEELKNLLMKLKEESDSTFKRQRSLHLVPSFHGK